MGNKLRKFLSGQSPQEDGVTGKEGTYTEKREEELQEAGTSQPTEQNEKGPDKMTEQSVSSTLSKDSQQHTESQQPCRGEGQEKQPSDGGEGEMKSTEDEQVSWGLAHSVAINGWISDQSPGMKVR